MKPKSNNPGFLERLIRFALSACPNWTFSILSARLQRMVIGEYAGIQLVDRNLNRDQQKQFQLRTQEALDLIRETDDRRFKRVRRHVRLIMNHPLDFGKGQYVSKSSACVVDFDCMNFENDPKAMLYVYAALIVHEATHGRIERHGIGSTKASRLRIERLCHLEEARFVKRLNRKLGEGWMDHSFKPGMYEWYWSLPRWKRALMAWQRRRGSEMPPR